ncbi:unnamed protein product, partial [Urochloa humidicola]
GGATRPRPLRRLTRSSRLPHPPRTSGLSDQCRGRWSCTAPAAARKGASGQGSWWLGSPFAATPAKRGGGRGEVATPMEDGDGTRSLFQAVLWGAEAAYISWLLPYAPGDPVWAISQATNSASL